MAEQKITTRQVLEAGWDEDRNGKKWEDYETIVCPNGQVIDMIALLDDQARAVASLVHLAPMLGGFLGKLRFIYTFKVKTQATDGYNVFVNPQFTAELDFTGKCFVMAHEVMHCLLNHMRREKTENMNHERANIAADYEVNITLADIGLFKEATMKALGAYVDSKYKNMSFESIYKAIKDSAKDDMGNNGQAGQADQNSDQREEGEGQGSQNGNNSGGSQQGQGSGQGQPQEHSDDYKAGWAQAAADYAAGKLKI